MVLAYAKRNRFANFLRNWVNKSIFKNVLQKYDLYFQKIISSQNLSVKML